MINNDFYVYKKNLLESLILLTIKKELTPEELLSFYELVQKVLQSQEQDKDILEAIDNILIKLSNTKKQEIERNKDFQRAQDSFNDFYIDYNNISRSDILKKRFQYDPRTNNFKYLSYRIFNPPEDRPNGSATND